MASGNIVWKTKTCAIVVGILVSVPKPTEDETFQKIYARRKTRVEHPFGHMKRNLKTDAFLLRGRDGVQAETSLLATCFNIARMMTILGVGTLLDKLAAERIEPAAV